MLENLRNDRDRPLIQPPTLSGPFPLPAIDRPQTALPTPREPRPGPYREGGLSSDGAEMGIAEAQDCPSE